MRCIYRLFQACTWISVESFEWWHKQALLGALFQDGKWCIIVKSSWNWSYCFIETHRGDCWKTYTVGRIIICMSFFLRVLCFLFLYLLLVALGEVVLILRNLCSDPQVFLVVTGPQDWKIHVLKSFTVRWAQESFKHWVLQMLNVSSFDCSAGDAKAAMLKQGEGTQ